MTVFSNSLRLSQLPPLNDSLLLRSISSRSLEAGRRHARAGRVRSVSVSEDERVITGETLGDAPRPYRQSISFKQDRRGGVQIDGVCNCGFTSPCKHVAAVLVAIGEGHVASIVPAAPPTEAPLPAEVTAWLQTLETGEDTASEAYPDSVHQRLFYVLDVGSGPAPGPEALRVACLIVQLRKDGSPGASRLYPMHQIDLPVAYVGPSDRVNLRRLARLHHKGGDLADDDEPADLLRRLIATGRARWRRADGPVVTEGPLRSGQIDWQVMPDGSQRTALRLDDGLVGFRLADAWYADPASGNVGPVDAGLPPGLAARLLAAPEIPIGAVSRVTAALAKRLPGAAVPPPQEMGPPEDLDVQVRPHLLLTTGALAFGLVHRQYPPRSVDLSGPEIPLARLSFFYGPVTLPFGLPSASPVMAQGGKLYRIVRDRAGEQAALARLGGIGFARVGDIVRTEAQPHRDDFLLEDDQDGTDWLSVVRDEVPALRRSGWTVEYADGFPVCVVEASGDIDAELREGSGVDWLELHLGVLIDGERVDLVPALVRLIAADAATAVMDDEAGDAPFLVPLADGRLLMLQPGRIRPMLQALIELFAGGGIDPDAERIAFTRHDAAELALLEERSGLVWQGGEAVRALGRQLRAAGGAIPRAAVPPTFNGTLRPYQADGVGWLQFLRAAGLGGVLADDMGLGKTVQTLAHLAIEQAEGRLDRPALIVCPTSLVPNWTLEAARFAPTLKLLQLHGPDRRERFAGIGGHDIVLTTYPLLTRDHEVLTAQDWHTLILDEAQTIKNPNAETTRQALRLQARQRLCLSGTPLQNHLGELWSLFDFLAPGFLGRAQAFRVRYRTPIEKQGDVGRQTSLARRVRPFLLRRTKEEVVQELPPKTEITEPVEMEAGQRAIYESVRLAMHTKVRAAIAERGLARSGIIILDALLKLRQACCDPRLLKRQATKHASAGSAKLNRLMEMLETMLSEGRHVLLFSQFTSMLALIGARLTEGGISYVQLTGDTVDRATPVRRFQRGEVPLFLISLKAGGVGLNLTAADTVIHYDPWWNPAVEDQATDRAHRIGQDKRVFVHRLITLGSIEEKMETLKEKKRALVASVLDAEHGGALMLTEADVEELFATG
jgi:superfamily II DNA or RNA helicase